MLIGILTFHDTTNFGSLLQTFGLYRAIEKMGYDCEIIDYQCESLVKRERPEPLRLSINIRKFARDVIFGRHRRIKYRMLHDFLISNMKLSPRYDKHNIKEAESRYDKIIVGSDIVWGYDIIDGDLNYFLEFVTDNKKKYAFSSSIGNPWKETEKEKIKPLLKSFQHICVREEESSQWVSELIGIMPEVVCDPTMLLMKNEWEQYVKPNTKTRYVLTYFDNEKNECINSAKKYAKSKNIKVFEISDGLSKDGIRRVKPHSLSEFLSLIFNAEQVVTASYHGLLFSLYFNKPVVYFNRAHKSRMNSLSQRISIQIVCCDGKDITTLSPLDYYKIEKEISNFRSFSINKLKEMLES